MDTSTPTNPNSSLPTQPTNPQLSSLPTNDPSVVTNQPKRKNSPIFVAGLAIFVLIMVFAGYQLFQKSDSDSNGQNPTPTPVVATISPTTNPTDTSNWQVFEDPTFGFQIKYPADMIGPLEKTLDNGLLENNSTFLFSSLSESLYTLIISIDPNTNNLSSEEFIRQQVEDTNQGEGPPSTIDPNLGKTISINSLPAFQIENVFSFDREDVVTVICNQEYCATVRYLEETSPIENFPEAEKYSAIFDQMLQTFKFVKATTTTTPLRPNPTPTTPVAVTESVSLVPTTDWQLVQAGTISFKIPAGATLTSQNCSNSYKICYRLVGHLSAPFQNAQTFIQMKPYLGGSRRVEADYSNSDITASDYDMKEKMFGENSVLDAYPICTIDSCISLRENIMVVGDSLVHVVNSVISEDAITNTIVSTMKPVD